jgi:hypothetical protein
MNVHLTSSTIARALDIGDLGPEEAALLVQKTPQPIVLGVFPGGEQATGMWVHVLRGGDCVEDANDPQQVAVLKFATSVASFAVKQICRSANTK